MHQIEAGHPCVDVKPGNSPRVVMVPVGDGVRNQAQVTSAETVCGHHTHKEDDRPCSERRSRVVRPQRCRLLLVVVREHACAACISDGGANHAVARVPRVRVTVGGERRHSALHVCHHADLSGRGCAGGFLVTFDKKPAENPGSHVSAEG